MKEEPAKVSLILGICSIVFIPLIILRITFWPLSLLAAIGAVVLGIRGLKSPKRRQAIWGIVCGSVGFILNVVLIVMIVGVAIGFARQ